MRKLKRIIALVTVAMFLLSLAAPAAMAATKEEAFSRLNALSVAVGDATGNPQYDKNFTRAEAAAIMVNLSGMKAAIEAAKGATKFKDVPASHWASGVINLAVGSGIIKGFPDGTYKPDENVTYAQMSAMLVGVLGYTPKLQGTWPSNVIGKAAQLGLLDGLTVTDYNAAAVRSNVFLASDNALDTAVLKEMKDGYQEGGVLMVEKLSVAKKAEGIVTSVPMTSGTKNKVVAGGETYDTIEGYDVNSLLGLKVQPWVKDNKVFFLDVKTNASDVINDSIKSINGNTNNPGATGVTPVGNTTVIRVKALDKDYTVANGVYVYNNYKYDAANTIGVGDSVRMILDSYGKVASIYVTSNKTSLADKIDTTNETISFKADGIINAVGSIDLKNKVVYIIKDGVSAKLADIKAGDVIEYLKSDAADAYIVYATSKSVTGKLTGAALNGTTASNADKFKVTVDGKEYNLGTANKAFYSIDDGKNFTAIAGLTDLNSVMNQTVKVIQKKNGDAFLINAGAASAANEFIALVKYTKVIDLGELKRYIYVTKADGTNTYYEVTKDAKINGATINETILKTAPANQPFEIANTDRSKQILANMVVKMSLTSDGKVDNFRLYTGTDILNATLTDNVLPAIDTYAGGTGTFGVDKNADSVSVGGSVYYAVNSDTKIFKVKTVNGSAYVDDAEMVSWSSLEALTNAQWGTVTSVVIKDAGLAKVIVIYNTTAALGLASDFKYGVLAEVGNDGKNYLKINEGATDPTKKEGTAGSGAVEDLVRFKIGSNDKFTDVTAVTAESTSSATYAYWKIQQVSTDNKQLKLTRCDVNGNDDASFVSIYRFYEPTKVKVFDISGTNSVVYVATPSLEGKVVKLYNAYDKDGKDIPDPTNTSDQILDFISIVK